MNRSAESESKPNQHKQTKSGDENSIDYFLTLGRYPYSIETTQEVIIKSNFDLLRLYTVSTKKVYSLYFGYNFLKS